MIRFVLDTNVIASGLIDQGGAPNRILRLWAANRFVLVISEHVLGELQQALAKPYFRRRLSEELIAQELARARAGSVVVDIPATLRGVARHSHDDPVLETAIVGKADGLATGDKQLRGLDVVAGIPILTPNEFLDLMVGAG